MASRWEVDLVRTEVIRQSREIRHMQSAYKHYHKDLLKAHTIYHGLAMEVQVLQNKVSVMRHELDELKEADGQKFVAVVKK